MNPLLQAALTSILRWALTLAAGYFVRYGIWSQGDAEVYVTAAAMALLTLGWSLWGKYRTRITILTALELPAGTTEHELGNTMKRQA